MKPATVKTTRFLSVKTTTQPRHIVALLKLLGAPNHILYARRVPQNVSFWTRPINHLHVLEQARRLYRHRIVQVYPDKSGGCLERTIELNRVWFDIKKCFKKNGHELW